MTGWFDHHAELSAAADVVSRRLEDEVVLVNLRSNRIFSLNRTGARYWELLLAGNRRAEIKTQLAGEFGVEPDDVAREIEKLEQELVSEGLVTEAV
jgi:coenzyme PQQ synthesis protein D (PqqD)